MVGARRERATFRYGQSNWLNGGNFDPNGFNVNNWDENGNDNLGALRWVVSRGKRRLGGFGLFDPAT